MWFDFSLPKMYFEETWWFGLVIKNGKLEEGRKGVEETGNLAFWSE